MNTFSAPTPAPQPQLTLTDKRKMTIGIPRPVATYQRRVLLTPEGAALLVERGIRVIIERGTGSLIHYTDTQYENAGAELRSRTDTLQADCVVYPAPLSCRDVMQMHRGAMLLTFANIHHQSADALNLLIEKRILSFALDLVADERGHAPFADIINEIDGHAAIALASSLLADGVNGKGILLGGVTGVVPCEVAIIGSNLAARTAARAAMGLGATVRMFDNDTYSLRAAIHDLGGGVIGSVMQPKTLASALRSADVIIATPVNPPFIAGPDVIQTLKRGVITFDINVPGAPVAFPTLPIVDLADATAADNSMDPTEIKRVLYVNPGNAVPRTAAMALSNTLISTMHALLDADGVRNSLRLYPGLAQGALTFLGKAVNPMIARITGQRYVDINLLVQFS